MLPDQVMTKLKPYVAGAVPDARGEVEMFCPMHNDTRRSASLNVELGVWWCHGGCGGGSVRHLVDSEDLWVGLEGRVKNGNPLSSLAQSFGPVPNQRQLKKEVVGWHKRLINDPERLRYLFELRGITKATAKRAELGWDGRHFKIPVWSPERDLWNVRTYDPKPRMGRRKIWGVRGSNRPRLYPAGVMEKLDPGDSVIFAEGEWDALLGLQTGKPTVTRTDGAGKPWHPEWTVAFAGLNVYVCQDVDKQGDTAREITAQALSAVSNVHICRLPYGWKPKGGRDLTDFLLDAEQPRVALGLLIEMAKPYEETT